MVRRKKALSRPSKFGRSSKRMPTKSYEEILLQELRDPDLSAEYLTATIAKRSLSAFKTALKKVVEGHGGTEALLELSGLSEREVEQLFNPETELSVRPLLALLKGLGLELISSICRSPSWDGSNVMKVKEVGSSSYSQQSEQIAESKRRARQDSEREVLERREAERVARNNSEGKGEQVDSTA
jgi:DNA-binding phage protein